MQFKKEIKSDKDIDYPIVFWSYDKERYEKEKDKNLIYKIDALKKIVNKIIKDFGVKKSILVLGRTKHDFDLFEESELFKRKEDELYYKESPNVKIRLLTVHKAKGLEDDNVILLNFENSTRGFPTKIMDDPIFELVLNKAEPFEYAEERRLLYVALTRTKNRVFILTNKNCPSEFFKDFLPPKPKVVHIYGNMGKEESCPRCITGRLSKKNGKNGKFLRCSNFPQCQYTRSVDSLFVELISSNNQQIAPVASNVLSSKAVIFQSHTAIPFEKAEKQINPNIKNIKIGQSVMHNVWGWGKITWINEYGTEFRVKFGNDSFERHFDNPSVFNFGSMTLC